jgi:hypothetical protein
VIVFSCEYDSLRRYGKKKKGTAPHCNLSFLTTEPQRFCDCV